MPHQDCPVIAFGLDAKEVSETRWLWHGLLAPGKMTLLTSLWKSGKTTLLAHLLARRRHGGDFLGLAVAPGVSLIVSEEPRDLWPERYRRHRLGEEVAVLSRPFPGRPALAQMEQLSADLVGLKQERGLDLVVFDSLAMFLPARTENSAGAIVDALAPFVALAEAGLAVWLLHHPAKGEPALGQAARGSGALLASVDIFLEMRHPGGNPFTRRRKLFGWSRHDETPRQMLIELSADGATYQRLADAGDDFHSNWDTVRLVLDASPPMTRQEIRAAWPPGATMPHDATLWRWLDRAVELGLASRTGQGTKNEPYRYGLPKLPLVSETRGSNYEAIELSEVAALSPRVQPREPAANTASCRSPSAHEPAPPMGKLEPQPPRPAPARPEPSEPKALESPEPPVRLPWPYSCMKPEEVPEEVWERARACGTPIKR